MRDLERVQQDIVFLLCDLWDFNWETSKVAGDLMFKSSNHLNNYVITCLVANVESSHLGLST